MNIYESIIDITRKSLDPLIFYKQGDKYYMRSDVVDFIKGIVNEIDTQIVSVNNYFIKGSILSFQWLDNTDVDLLIEVDEMSEENRRRIQRIIDDKYNIVIPGTKHPLQIYVHAGTYDKRNADGIYDLDKGWIKGPYNIAVNINDYLEKFNKVVSSIDISTGKLKRELIDYDILKRLSKDEIEDLEHRIHDKLNSINKIVNDLVNQYKHIKDMRHKVFETELSPDDIVKYGTKNALPENVIFKLLERYYYLKFLRELKTISSNNVIDTDEDVTKVKQAVEKSQLI